MAAPYTNLQADFRILHAKPRNMRALRAADRMQMLQVSQPIYDSNQQFAAMPQVGFRNSFIRETNQQNLIVCGFSFELSFANCG
jgi:hypothetical protein